MCKQGIMIGRNTSFKIRSFSVQAGQRQNNALPARADRISLSIAMWNAGAGSATDIAAITIGGGTSTDVVCALSVGSPYKLLTVEEYGVLMTGHMGVDLTMCLNAYNFTFIEHYPNPKLE